MPAIIPAAFASRFKRRKYVLVGLKWRNGKLTVMLYSTQFTLRSLKKTVYPSSLTRALILDQGAMIRTAFHVPINVGQDNRCHLQQEFPIRLLRRFGTGPWESELLRCFLNGSNEDRWQVWVVSLSNSPSLHRDVQNTANWKPNLRKATEMEKH